MLSKFVAEGDRIELQAVVRGAGAGKEEESKTYLSAVHEILSEDTMEITMPQEKGKLVLLPIDSEYELVFYCESGIYQCLVRVIDRYRSNNVNILVIELISNLRKYQRRDFYRLSCALEMKTRSLTEEERCAVEQGKSINVKKIAQLERSVIVDISGGGLRFMSLQKYEVGSLVYCSYELLRDGERKHYDLIGKVLSMKAVENKPDTFEHRIQFHNMRVGTREEIIRFIFEEERKHRKKKE